MKELERRIEETKKLITYYENKLEFPDNTNGKEYYIERIHELRIQLQCYLEIQVLLGSDEK